MSVLLYSAMQQASVLAVARLSVQMNAAHSAITFCQTMLIVPLLTALSF